jgi:hypothetical protein
MADAPDKAKNQSLWRHHGPRENMSLVREIILVQHYASSGTLQTGPLYYPVIRLSFSASYYCDGWVDMPISTGETRGSVNGFEETFGPCAPSPLAPQPDSANPARQVVTSVMPMLDQAAIHKNRHVLKPLNSIPRCAMSDVSLYQPRLDPRRGGGSSHLLRELIV